MRSELVSRPPAPDAATQILWPLQVNLNYPNGWQTRFTRRRADYQYLIRWYSDPEDAGKLSPAGLPLQLFKML